MGHQSVESMTTGFHRQLILCVMVIASFELAYTVEILSLPAMTSFALLTLRMSRTSTRTAFYSGLAVGTAIAGMELSFFFTVFGPGALGLWMVLGVWFGLFTLCSAVFRRKFPALGVWLLPTAWTGLEFFRSELYYLRFSWVTPGLALANGPWQDLLVLGQYGVSGLIFLLAVIVERRPIVGTMILGAICVLPTVLPAEISSVQPVADSVVFAGIQLEHPPESEVPRRLKQVLDSVPDADVIVLSEYTFDGPVPDSVLEWCDDRNLYVVVGGKVNLPDGSFFNTTFVVGPSGTLVHQQAKAVPIQFFNDGLPAETQDIWDSPWGGIGFAVCYDMSYTRVMDRLVRGGAQAIINPTMDPIEWGLYEHRLHARIPVARATEYGIPVIRIASSGISVLADSAGNIRATGRYPGPGQIVSARIQLPKDGRIPADRWLSWLCLAATGCALVAGRGKTTT